MPLNAQTMSSISSCSRWAATWTVYAYVGTHYHPYWERDLHQSFPLILKALGE
jgi:S-formylglutathione hydrolase FrmB